MIAIDAASSEWWNDEEKCYIQPKSGKKLTQTAAGRHVEDLR